MAVQRIRPLALCVFHRDGKILVNEFYDAIKKERFFRPIGGGIEFGETSAQAIIREVQEELGLPITNIRLIGTLESIFIYNGNPGHEIVQVYDAQFEDVGVYELLYLNGQESDGSAFTVRWHEISSFTSKSPLVPDGLYELLKKAALLA
ncbi:NUDIX hydrolase [Pseudomonas sp.]|uniref:NUDIX hydrolase n=1 Tax=Pseudomonas sp. TaxID=306 RepID=UPI0026155742|nr:NUDIX hydrolase [Pseudomonas sp.]